MIREAKAPVRRHRGFAPTRLLRSTRLGLRVGACRIGRDRGWIGLSGGRGSHRPVHLTGRGGGACARGGRAGARGGRAGARCIGVAAG